MAGSRQGNQSWSAARRDAFCQQGKSEQYSAATAAAGDDDGGVAGSEATKQPSDRHVWGNPECSKIIQECQRVACKNFRWTVLRKYAADRGQAFTKIKGRYLCNIFWQYPHHMQSYKKSPVAL